MIENKNVAIVIPNLGQGGVERYAVQLAKGMQENGSNCTIITFENVPVAQQLSGAIKVHHVCCATTGRFQFIKSVIKLRRYLQQNHVDLIISGKEQGNILTYLAQLFKKPSYSWFVTRHVPLEPGQSKGDVRWYTKKLYKYLYYKAKAFIGVTDEIAAQLKVTVPKSKQHNVKAIKNPIIDPDIFTFSERTPNKLNGWPANKRVILGAGRLAEQKGFDLLITAFEKIASTIPDADLVLIGEGEDRESLENLCRTLGVQDRVHFLGYTDNPWYFMRQSSLFVLSSRWEGLSIVLPEAIALGRPVVSFDCPTGPRMLLGDDSPALVAFPDTDALANAMQLQLDSPFCPLVDLSEFHTRQSAKNYLSLL
ncbi:glycosyltransferase [Thalassotalea sp. G2M2-11]|uniref:glycosyltransferase n=1 Tax=Thalassotalea sp. G2M2-11 TaxID=2787627 RepID=UPI0019D16F54|nr:glycosyltransferase [Thalassotalea sp. G2M2-11]